MIVIPEDNLDDIARFGLDPGMVKRKPSQGGGFVVEAEGLHHLHCLNLVRQAVWFNYDYYKAQGGGPFKNEDNILRKHVGEPLLCGTCESFGSLHPQATVSTSSANSSCARSTRVYSASGG